MSKLIWSGTDTDKDGLVEFLDPKTGKSVRTFSTAIVYFPSGTRVCGTDSMQRKEG